MKRSTWFVLLTLILIFVMLFPASGATAQEQDPPPPEKQSQGKHPEQSLGKPPVPGAVPGPSGKGFMLSQEAAQAFQPQAVNATGGPDDYGYSWQEQGVDWKDATDGGTLTNLSSAEWYPDVSSAIDLGFDFKFYNYTYSSIYISAAGAVGFDYYGLTYETGTGYIPSADDPNNFIAPYLAPLTVNSGAYTGRVWYARGGSSPNRYFVAEWYQVNDTLGGAYTFEVVLWENGTIDLKYLTMAHTQGSWWCGTAAGIENSDGTDGLAYRNGEYCNNMTSASNTTVRYQRPAQMARVKVRDNTLGSFSYPNGVTDYIVWVQNTGELGDDTYYLSLSSTWPGQILDNDKVTPLTDTGIISMNANRSFIVQIKAPAGTSLGNQDVSSLLITSKTDPSKTKVVTFQTAIPAPFAEIFFDYMDTSPKLLLAKPFGQFASPISQNENYTTSMAVTEMPNGNFAVTWTKGYCVDNECNRYIGELFISILDKHGRLLSQRKLTDYSASAYTEEDYDLGIDVTPDGTIGILFKHYIYDPAANAYSYNMYFAASASDGHLISGPVNLTNYGLTSSLSGSSSYLYTPNIAATGDNRFVLAWDRTSRTNNQYLYDIYVAVRSSSGSQVKATTKFTSDTTSYGGYSDVALSSLVGNQAVISYYRWSDNEWVIYSGILNSSGNKQVNPHPVTSNYGYYIDSAQLSNGNILLAWNSGSNLYYTVLDSNTTKLTADTPLQTPGNILGGGYVSVSPDTQGNAILTWMGYNYSERRHLYYALINQNGSLVTPPMVSRTTKNYWSGIETTYSGYGNTTYSYNPPAGVDGVLNIPTLVGGPASTVVTIPVKIENVGAGTATGVSLQVTLDADLTYSGNSLGLPSISGSTYTWNLDNLGYLGRVEFELYVTLPVGSIGDQHPVNFVLEPQADLTPVNNLVTTQVMIARQLFVPYITNQ